MLYFHTMSARKDKKNENENLSIHSFLLIGLGTQYK